MTAPNCLAAASKGIRAPSGHRAPAAAAPGGATACADGRERSPAARYLALASQSAATSRQLRAALRSRDELRHQMAEAASLDDAVRAAVSRRSLRAAQALCASLRARVYALEGQVAQLQSAACAADGGETTPCAAARPRHDTGWGGDAIPDTPRSRSPRKFSSPSSPAGSLGAAVLGRDRSRQRAADRRDGSHRVHPGGLPMTRSGGGGGGSAGGGG